MARVTRVQREFAERRLVLPDARTASVSERAWLVLVRHVRVEDVHISQHTAGQLAPQAAALRYPDLVDLPRVIRQALVLGGYTTRKAVARASDADLLVLTGMSPARLRAVREIIPRAG